MPIMDFFDWTTSPSTILAVVYRTLAEEYKDKGLRGEWRGCLDVGRRKVCTDDGERCEGEFWIKEGAEKKALVRTLLEISKWLEW